jgi:transketolase
MGKDISSLEAISREVRKSILKLIRETGSPHIGPSLSIVEILVALYYEFLNVSPESINDLDRDRFILSKGHACASLYAVLAERGYFKPEDLDGFAISDGIFEQHPNIDCDRGIEVSSGALGHGLSIGAGMALASKIRGHFYKTVVLLSDGELNEGTVWEAVMFAAQHKLDNLLALVDANQMQALGFTRDILDLHPLKEKWEAFGWHAQDIDGHDFEEILNALDGIETGRPNVIILNTIKGKGISFMENDILWHYRAPDEDEYRRALEELG